ncbi:FtsK/SpoIIIE domain-containing protein [Blastococcus sp. SYSU D00695]
MSAPPIPAPARTRRWTLVGATGALDVEVTAPEEAPLAAVAAELVAVAGPAARELWAGPARVAGDAELRAPALAHGAVLGLGRPGPAPAAPVPATALALHVVGGPDAGRSVPLAAGRHVLGRGTAAGVPLEDPDVSRRHALVEIGAGRVTVADAGSANGSRVDDDVLGTEPAEWPEDAVLRIGSSALVVRGPDGTRLPAAPDPGGRTRVQPVGSARAVPAETEVRFPTAPAAPVRRRLPWIALALPAVAGVTGAWLLDAPTFLFFALLSPMVAVGSWLGERWGGRGARRRDALAHAEELAAAQDQLDQAVLADRRAAESAAPDLARLAVAARRRSTPLWGRRSDDAGALAVRLGRGPGTTSVVRVDGDGTRTPQSCADLPVTVDLAAAGGLGVDGPRARSVGVLRSVLVQACALLPPTDLAVSVLTTGDRLADWRWTRWLPHVEDSRVRVSAAGEAERADLAWLGAVVAARAGAAPGRPGPQGSPAARPWLLVVLDRPAGRRLVDALRDARPAGVLVLATAGKGAVETGAHVRVTGETGQRAVLSQTSAAPREFVVDHLSRTAAAAVARDLAPLTTPASGSGQPATHVRLRDVLAADPVEDGAGGWSRRRDTLHAVLGRTAEGVVSVDLCRDGPHALVAGTTGSGKSELLQCLVASLAAAHPPDRCAFLLVDYKGGAAFAEAAALPHTVGVVTDLDARAADRALRSLGAELTRRETVLAAAGVADLADLPEHVALARLVIVVDEFAGLAEEQPDFLPGLVAIAQRGRSLGVHLVLATQRPAGVVSPEIRANCSLRICLRTTDEADSRDVLGTAAAAFLPAARPGRAYLRRGPGTPALLQVARVAGRPPAGPARPRVRRWTWPDDGEGVVTSPGTGPTDLELLVAALTARAGREGVRRPHRPWCPPLPDRLAAADLDAPGRAPATSGAGPGLAIGLLDRPDLQRQDALTVDLAAGGGWLVVGGPASGRSTVLHTVLSEAVTAYRPDELHLHVLDHGGGLLSRVAAGLPHAGTTVGAGDPLRTMRLVDRLAAEVSARRAAGRSSPRLLLLVDGVESLSAQLDEADPARGSAALLRLVREGGAAGLTCVLTADRAVPGGRLAAAVGTRLVLPLPDRADYGVAGVPARAVPAHRPPGRALVGEAAHECQLALPRPLPACEVPGDPAALRIPELPADPELPLPSPEETDPLPLTVPVGPGGDEGRVLTVDLRRSGGLLLAGPPGSGRSAALTAFTAHLVAAGVRVCRVVPPGAGTDPLPPGTTVVGAADLPAWQDWVAGLAGATGVVTVDDHAGVAESPVLAALAADAPGDVLAVVTGSPSDLATVFRGPVAALRRRRSGLLLAPGPGDADLLGVRLPRAPVPVRPGSGWLVDAGVPSRVQVALRRTATAPAPAPA